MPKVDARIAKDSEKFSGAGDIYTYEDKIYMMVKAEDWGYFYLIDLETGIELEEQGRNPTDLLDQISVGYNCRSEEFIKAPEGSKITLTV